MRIGIDARLWEETGVGRYIRNLVWHLQDLDTENDYVLFVKKGSKNHEARIKFLPENRIQMEGKQPVSVKDFINGYPELREQITKLLA